MDIDDAACRWRKLRDVTLDDFTADAIQTGETHIFVRRHGSGPRRLLPHGFPQTHVMWSVSRLGWRTASPVVCADLRGYGRSGCRTSAPDHTPLLAHDMVAVHRPRARGRDRPRREESREERRLLDTHTLMCRARRNRLPGGTSSGGGYIASGLIARDLGLKLWWHPVNARQSLERLADRESA